MIADVPESGGKRSLLLVAVLATLLIAGVAYFAFKGKGSDTSAGKGGSNDKGGSADVVAKGGSDQQTTPELGGSNNGSTQVQVPDTNGSQQTVTPPANDEAARIALECKQIATEKRWTDAMNCADKLAAQDPAESKRLKAAYKQELENSLSNDDLAQAVAKKKLGDAKKKLAEIEETSVYRGPAAQKVADLEELITQRYQSSAAAAKRSGKCGEIDKIVADARDEVGPKAAALVAKEKCDKPPPPTDKDCKDELLNNSTACKKQFCNVAAHKDDPKCGTGAVVPVAPANCDAEALKEEGVSAVSLGQHALALSKFEASLNCKFNSYVLQLAFMEACASSNSTKATKFYKQLSAAQQSKFAQMCIRTNTTYKSPGTP